MTCGWNARKGKALDGQFEDVKSVDELMYSDDTRLPERPLADARALTFGGGVFLVAGCYSDLL